MKMYFIALWCAVASVVAAADVQKLSEGQKLAAETSTAIELFKKTDSKIGNLFSSSAGYAVFPSVTKGAIGIGAAHGTGEVFTKKRMIGTATLTQVTIGLQLGGQEYAEVIFFEDQAALDAFTVSKFTMSAQVSAVAAAEGSSGNAKYRQGVLVFTIAKGGLMFEASVGGQKFKFTPR